MSEKATATCRSKRRERTCESWFWRRMMSVRESFSRSRSTMLIRGSAKAEPGARPWALYPPPPTRSTRAKAVVDRRLLALRRGLVAHQVGLLVDQDPGHLLGQIERRLRAQPVALLEQAPQLTPGRDRLL